MRARVQILAILGFRMCRGPGGAGDGTGCEGGPLQSNASRRPPIQRACLQLEQPVRPDLLSEVDAPNS